MTRNPYTTPLHPAEYQPTERFIKMMAFAQAGVCFEDEGLVAVTGNADDPESQVYSLLLAAAPEMFRALQALVDEAHHQWVTGKEWTPPFEVRLLSDAKRALHLANPTLYPEYCREARCHTFFDIFAAHSYTKKEVSK